MANISRFYVLFLNYECFWMNQLAEWLRESLRQITNSKNSQFFMSANILLITYLQISRQHEAKFIWLVICNGQFCIQISSLTTARFSKSSDHCCFHTARQSGVAFIHCCFLIARWTGDRRFHTADNSVWSTNYSQTQTRSEGNNARSRWYYGL